MLTRLEVPLGWKQLIVYHDLGKCFFEGKQSENSTALAIFKSFNCSATFNLLFWVGSCKTRLVETWDQVQFEQVWCAIHKKMKEIAELVTYFLYLDEEIGFFERW